MSVIERGRESLREWSAGRRAARAADGDSLNRLHDEATVLNERMSAMLTCTGDRTVLEEITGQLFDYVDVPGPEKSLSGNGSRTVTVHRGGHYISGREDSIFAKAAELGADGLVNFRTGGLMVRLGRRVVIQPIHQGIPVKKRPHRGPPPFPNALR